MVKFDQKTEFQFVLLLYSWGLTLTMKSRQMEFLKLNARTRYLSYDQGFCAHNAFQTKTNINIMLTTTPPPVFHMR